MKDNIGNSKTGGSQDPLIAALHQTIGEAVNQAVDRAVGTALNGALEAQLKPIVVSIDELREETAARFDKLEGETAARFDKLEGETAARFDKLEGNMVTKEMFYTLKDTVDTLVIDTHAQDKKVATLTADVDVLKKDVAHLKKHQRR